MSNTFIVDGGEHGTTVRIPFTVDGIECEAEVNMTVTAAPKDAFEADPENPPVELTVAQSNMIREHAEYVLREGIHAMVSRELEQTSQEVTEDYIRNLDKAGYSVEEIHKIVELNGTTGFDQSRIEELAGKEPGDTLTGNEEAITRYILDNHDKDHSVKQILEALNSSGIKGYTVGKIKKVIASREKGAAAK